MPSRMQFAIALLVAFLAATFMFPHFALAQSCPPPTYLCGRTSSSPDPWASRTQLERHVLSQSGGNVQIVKQVVVVGGSQPERVVQQRVVTKREFDRFFNRELRGMLENPANTGLERVRKELRDLGWATGTGRNFRLKSGVTGRHVLYAYGKILDSHETRITKIEQRLNDPKKGLDALNMRVDELDKWQNGFRDGAPLLLWAIAIAALIIAILALLCCLFRRYWPGRVVYEEV